MTEEVKLGVINLEKNQRELFDKITTLTRERLAREHQAALDKLLAERNSIETLKQSYLIFGGLVALMLSFAGFLGISSFNELKETIQAQAEKELSNAVTGQANGISEIEKLRTSYETATLRASKIAEELDSYSTLISAIDTAESFDPLINYFELADEIAERGTRSDFFEVDFRRRASVTFHKLLVALREDYRTGKNRVDTINLFNAASDAARIDMAFVALELMELAAQIDSKNSQEIQSRLIRQKLVMSLIDLDTAIEELTPIIQDIGYYDLHLVVAEAYNVGTKGADPTRVAALLLETAPEAHRGNSYLLFNAAQLTLMGGTAGHHNAAEELVKRGIRSLSTEHMGARWYEGSLNDLSTLLDQSPDWNDLVPDTIKDLMEK